LSISALGYFDLRALQAAWLAVVCASAAGCGGASAQESARWLVRGEAVVTCPCRVPCPCRSNAPPSRPRCENLSYVRIVEGNYGSVKLNGVEYVWAADECTGGHSSRKPTTLYFPRGVAQKQITAVENIMTGDCSHTGSPEMHASHVDLTAGIAGSVYS